jgi:hypothetical protein
MSEARYLISIGINDYEIQPLDFCVKDSEDITDLMKLYCKVEEKNCFIISSETNKPNHNIYENLIIAFERIRSSFAEGDDSIFFYFSGHGTKAGNSTALVFYDKVIELQELFKLFSTLKPKFIFCLIDSCYSGVGIIDEIGKSSDELLFAQHLRLASGYNIICASASDSPAKEDQDLRNGRLTKLFIDIIRNKINYKDGILSLSKVFQLVDDSFKKKPEFRQFPFAQTKGLSTYPIALEDDLKESIYYSQHYIDEVDTYDWEEFKADLLKYCNIRNEVINEFTRLVREILRNSKTWGKATFCNIEISKNCVSLLDNSGSRFDIFNPPQDTKLRGGGITAARFLASFGNDFTCETRYLKEETIQIFSFKESENNSCIWNVSITRQLIEFQRGMIISIPDECSDYIIHVPHGYLDLSTISSFLKAVIYSSQKAIKPITIIIDDKDILKQDFIQALEWYKESEPHLVTIK